MYDEKAYDKFIERLQTDYPAMFANPYGGVTVGPGWWPIIKSLCRQIQHHIDWKNEQHEKYGRGEGCPQVTVAQIKEKFGGLRFYYSGGDDYIEAMVELAEYLSDVTCDVCGAPGEKRGGGWIATRCEAHI